MTIQGFGRFTPVQAYMLGLIGWRIKTMGESTLEIPDAERKEIMQIGLDWLRQITGKDFGYDLAAWHEFLTTNSDDFGYKHPYGHSGVKKAVKNAMSDPKRDQLVLELESDH